MALCAARGIGVAGLGSAGRESTATTTCSRTPSAGEPACRTHWIIRTGGAEGPSDPCSRRSPVRDPGGNRGRRTGRQDRPDPRTRSGRAGSGGAAAQASAQRYGHLSPHEPGPGASAPRHRRRPGGPSGRVLRSGDEPRNRPPQRPRQPRREPAPRPHRRRSGAGRQQQRGRPGPGPHRPGVRTRSPAVPRRDGRDRRFVPHSGHPRGERRAPDRGGHNESHAHRRLRTRPPPGRLPGAQGVPEQLPDHGLRRGSRTGGARRLCPPPRPAAAGRRGQRHAATGGRAPTPRSPELR